MVRESVGVIETQEIRENGNLPSGYSFFRFSDFQTFPIYARTLSAVEGGEAGLSLSRDADEDQADTLLWSVPRVDLSKPASVSVRFIPVEGSGAGATDWLDDDTFTGHFFAGLFGRDILIVTFHNDGGDRSIQVHGASTESTRTPIASTTVDWSDSIVDVLIVHDPERRTITVSANVNEAGLFDICVVNTGEPTQVQPSLRFGTKTVASLENVSALFGLASGLETSSLVYHIGIGERGRVLVRGGYAASGSESSVLSAADLLTEADLDPAGDGLVAMEVPDTSSWVLDVVFYADAGEHPGSADTGLAFSVSNGDYAAYIALIDDFTSRYVGIASALPVDVPDDDLQATFQQDWAGTLRLRVSVVGDAALLYWNGNRTPDSITLTLSASGTGIQYGILRDESRTGVLTVESALFMPNVFHIEPGRSSTWDGVGLLGYLETGYSFSTGQTVVCGDLSAYRAGALWIDLTISGWVDASGNFMIPRAVVGPIAGVRIRSSWLLLYAVVKDNGDVVLFVPGNDIESARVAVLSGTYEKAVTASSGTALLRVIEGVGGEFWFNDALIGSMGWGDSYPSGPDEWADSAYGIGPPGVSVTMEVHSAYASDVQDLRLRAQLSEDDGAEGRVGVLSMVLEEE
ncbi:hypothetical protein EBT31_00020 [bacterium]|nr:hypothetical protein [bacterium]